MRHVSALSVRRAGSAVAADMIDAGKPPKIILVAVARKLLVHVHAVVRTQKPVQPFPDALPSI